MNEKRSAAQLLYDAFRQIETIIESEDDLMLFEKNGLFYVGDEDNFFVGGFPKNLAIKYFEDRMIDRLVKLAHKDPKKLEKLIKLGVIE